MSEEVTRAEFTVIERELGDMKSLMQRMVDAMTRLALLDERQQGMFDTSKEILKRIAGIEQRQHNAELTAAHNGDMAGRLKVLESAFKELHTERVTERASFKTAVWMVRAMWLGVPAAAAVLVWATKHGFIG